MISLAVLGQSLSVLLKLVVEAKAISFNFRDILTRLESTLKAIIPRCVEISRLNNELDISQQGMKELEVIISDGQALVLECSKIYSIDLVKKWKYFNKLSDLETTLLRYFTTILPLDHLKDTKEILVVLKRLELKLVGNEDEGGVLNQGELSDKPKDDFGRSGVQETPKLYNNDYEKESLKELVSVNDGKICNGSESEKPKDDDLYRNSKKKELVVGDHFVGICEIRKAQFCKNLPCELGKPKEDSVFHRKPMKKLFPLKGYAYDIDLGDLEPFNLVSKGTNVTSYRCNAQQRDVFVKSINLEVQVTESDFKQRMEDIGKVGQHPNIMLPFGYSFSETGRYLLYDYAPGSSLYALSKEPKSLGTRPHWDRSLKIILGAARGISHIHSQGGIIHGNIKSSNVLVTADYDGFISDFGLAPMMNIPALTPELSAPELKETREATQKSDVYNFGVMLSEIVNQYSKLWLYGWFAGLEQVVIRQIIGKCKDTDPDRRPTMDEVVKLITQQVQSEPCDNKQQSLLKIECDKLAENPKEDSTSGIKQATKMLHDDSEDSVFHRKPMKKLFLLKGCAYDIDLGDLEPFNLVSKGTNVTSYRCNAQQRDIFVKSINLEVQVRESEFKQRMEDIGKVGQHPNIMLPFGYLFSETARYLLYDYAPESSLYAHSKDHKSLGTRPHWDRSLKIILGAARGISHIHSQGGIIHGNIKSSNVLVTADYDGFISDFGLAPMTNIPAFTPELSAPELKETGEATQKSDVYNFGVMLSEIVNQYGKLWLYGWFVGLEQVVIRQIIGKCKDTDPDRRPTMDEVVKLIQQVQSAENPKEDSTSGIKQATKMWHYDSEKEVYMKLLDDVDEGICDQNESGKTMKVPRSEMQYGMELVQAFRKKDETTKLNPKYVQIKPPGTKLFLLKGCLHHNLDLQDLQWSEADSLGNGICGTTYRCNTKYGEFRIKQLGEVNVGEKEFKQRVEELGKVGQHSNIMPPFGYYFSEFEKFLVYDYSPEGSLSALLHENKSSGRSPLDWNSRVKIALGTARGIAHLHSKGGGVKLLGSIKSSNILLTSDFDGCISDYGLTPIMNFFASSSQESGDHVPKISLNSSLKVCQKSDVYDFGLLLLEILTGKKPALVDLPRWIREEKPLNVLFDMELLEFQHFEAEMKQMLQIAMQCVEMNPDKRPKMDGVVRLVENLSFFLM